MLKSPIGDCFVFVRKSIAEIIGEKNVYDYLPGESTSYPFCYIGESFSSDIQTKWGYGSSVTITCHFYTDQYNKRGSFTEMINSCLNKLKVTNKNKGYKFKLKDYRTQISGDTTTSRLLLHGILELTMEFL